MSEYTVIKNSAGVIQCIRRDDGASIPVCEGNMDYVRFMEETMGGVYPEEIIPDPAPPGPSVEERLAAAEDMIAAIIEGAI